MRRSGAGRDDLSRRILHLLAHLLADVSYQPRDAVRRQIAQQLLKDRRRRQSHFEGIGETFTEPSWDMLLDLYVCQLDGRKVSTSSLCLAGGVPPTTGLRWIALLEKRGWTESYAMEEDRRCRLVRLTPRSMTAMAEYLDAIDPVGGTPLSDDLMPG